MTTYLLKATLAHAYTAHTKTYSTTIQALDDGNAERQAREILDNLAADLIVENFSVRAI
jgi:hypothetical protein